MPLTNLQFLALVTGTVGTLIGAPLAAILFYLRAIRDDQTARQSMHEQRLTFVAADLRTVRDSVNTVERTYTTKDEWTRETMLARHQLERLTELMARIEAELEQSHGLATQFLRATNAIVALAERLSTLRNPE